MAKKVARLFEQFQPENYRLHFVPDRDKMTFSGSVVITGKKVGRPSERITFHQKDLKITSAKVTRHDKKGDQELTIARINNHDSLNELRVHTKDKIFPGSYTVALKFEGKITKPMHGIYPCNFTHEGKKKMLIATQFESHHAREGFPCIDEPEAKATFDLTLTTPGGETVIANTPAKTQKRVSGGVETTFETTPRMSTYLLAFVYGELDYAEGKTKNGTVVRTYATPEQAVLTRYSVDFAVKSLEFFEEYYGVAYPLAKLDMAALPDFSAAAMENWGLVTYRESVLLIDEKTTGIETKQMMAMVVAHELSHQWFGNLVTMKWWDDLWLNESFANMMEYLAVDAIYPEWHIWEHFVSSETASAKRRDSLANVQSVRMPVNHPDEISTLFDPSIVYAKGGSLLHMLMAYIGEDNFRRGLSSYFKKHAYGNTVASDLWEALGQASQHDISGFMDDWLNRPGYPLVAIEWQPGSAEVKLGQRRFLSDPDAQPGTDKPWQVPLAATIDLDEPLLTKASQTCRVTGETDRPLLFNHDGASYFLPLYKTPEHLSQIIDALRAGKVDTIDRLLLVDSYNLLQRGGESSTTELLELLGAYSNEDAESVWGAVALAIAEVRKLVEGDEAAEAKLNELIEKLVMPTVERLGWDDSEADDAQTLRLRGLALSLAAGAKVDTVLSEAKKRFATFKKPNDLSATIRSVVYFVGARHGTEADFQKLLKLHNNTGNADEKEELAAGITSVKEEQQYETLLDMLMTDQVRRQDFMHWYVWLLRNRYSRQRSWQWLTQHWDWLEKELSGDKSYSYAARYSGSIFTKPDELKKFQKFFEPKKDNLSLRRDIVLGEQEITSRIAWRARNEAAVKAWLNKL